MFKSRYSSFRKKRSNIRPWYFVVGLPLALIILEMLTRLFVGLAGKNQELMNADGNTPMENAYKLKFVDDLDHPYNGLSPQGKLIAKRHLLLGYQLVGKQKNDFLQINEQGFRDNQPISKSKPQDEIRIFVLGGSSAFGEMSLNNQTTFAHKLEAKLNQRVEDQKTHPDRYRPQPLPVYYPEKIKALALPSQIKPLKYRVINAAVPGYSSGNELAQLVTKVMPYQPDVIIVMNGYADLLLPSNQPATDIPNLDKFLSDPQGHYQTFLAQETNKLLNNIYLVKVINSWVLNPQNKSNTAITQVLPKDRKELQLRRERYQENMTQMAKITTASNLPLLIAIQPEITGKNANTSPEEKKILIQLDNTYKQTIKNGYEQLTSATAQVKKLFPENLKILNLYKIYDKFASRAFHDPIHLTDEAQTIIADQLYTNILELPQLSIEKRKPNTEEE
jgi:hypothetical protein